MAIVMDADDLVFRALADPVRRMLLDALFQRDGRSLGELEAAVNQHVEMTRFGVAKHLRLLEQADLVISRKQGRAKLHHLNPVPSSRSTSAGSASTPSGPASLPSCSTSSTTSRHPKASRHPRSRRTTHHE